MKYIIIVTLILVVGLTAGFLVVKNTTLEEVSNTTDQTKSLVLHELPPTNKVLGEEVSTTSDMSEQIKSEANGSNDSASQLVVPEVVSFVRVDIEGCPYDLKEYMHTLYRICINYTSNGKHIYFKDIQMEADKDTFEIFPVSMQDFVSSTNPDWLFARDANFVYFQGTALKGVTPEQFNILGLDTATFDIFKASQTLRIIIEANPNLPLLETLFSESDLSGRHMDEFGLSLLKNPDYVVAVLNGKNIMYSEIGMMHFPAQVPSSRLVSPDTHEEWKKKLTNELIERKLLIEAAEKYNLAPTSEEFETKLSKYINNLGGEEFVRRRMKISGMNESQLHDKIRGRMAIENLEKEVIFTDLQEISREEIVEYYDEWWVQNQSSLKLEDVEEAIILQLHLTQKKELLSNYVANLKKSANIVILWSGGN